MIDTGGSGGVVLVRHGATEWSLAGKHTGRTDVPLLEEGRRQARALADRLAGTDFARVMTSPLSRAVDTARLAGFDERAELRGDLLEWDYGEYEGMTTPAIRALRPGWTLWCDGAPGGESAPDVGRRVDRVIAELRDGRGPSIVFGHAHVLRVLAARWLGLGPEEGRCFVLSPATTSVLAYERESPAVLLWNDPA